MIRLTRRYRFSASHRLHAANLSESENRELFGKCNNPYGHGHDYVLDVSVEGRLDPSTGQVVRLADLDRLVKDRVLRDFEHRNLNADVPEFEEIIPTSENIVRAIETRLREKWASAFAAEAPRLTGIRLQETRRNRFELTT
jgi:6-pyruvoyltetrahydropterin/6-carboxytetrahydropterin synthase